jgi:hypothetical protein
MNLTNNKVVGSYGIIIVCRFDRRNILHFEIFKLDSYNLPMQLFLIRLSITCPSRVIIFSITKKRLIYLAQIGEERL